MSDQWCGATWLLLLFLRMHVHSLLPGPGCQVIPLSICLPIACHYAAGYGKGSSRVLHHTVCQLHDSFWLKIAQQKY